jgi:hypothetical protein
MADPPTVTEALLAVMADVGAIRKGERNKDQGFNFRGIDTVTNACQPAFIKHGVHVRPIAEEIQFESYTTKHGTHMRNCVVKMRYVFTGPAGDQVEACTYGEAADAGDKSVSKAQSVAERVALLQALMIPTDDPEPDASAHQRASSGPAPAAAPAPGAGPTYPQGSPKAQYAQAMQRLSTEQRLAVKAELVHRRLPQLVTEMDDDQAEMATRVLHGMFAEEATTT